MARRTLPALAGAALVALVMAAPSGAAVTIGGDVSTPATSFNSCNNGSGDPFGCTWFNASVPGRTITAPINGVVVRWRLHPASGSDAQNVRLRILRPAGGTAYESRGASTAQPISTTGGLQVFPTRLPIRTDDHIGVDQGNGGANASFGRPFTGAEQKLFNPRLPDSGAVSPSSAPGAPVELVLNADIEADADGDKFGDETRGPVPHQRGDSGTMPAGHTPVRRRGGQRRRRRDRQGRSGLFERRDSFNPADLNEGDESVRDLVLCGRRAISLVRADAKGRRVVLKGLVSTKQAGRPVQIFANYGTGARRHSDV